MIASNIHNIATEFGEDWVCADIDEFQLQNDPATYRSNYGESFNMVINRCDVAKQIEADNGLSSYAEERPCYEPKGVGDDTWDNYVSLFMFRGKGMTRNAGEPDYYLKHGESETYFTSRITTFGVPNLGQIYRMQAQ